MQNFIIKTIFQELTVISVTIESTTRARAQLNMKAYRLMRNRMMVRLSFDFHMTSTSKGAVRRYSYVYQAKLEISMLQKIHFTDLPNPATTT